MCFNLKSFNTFNEQVHSLRRGRKRRELIAVGEVLCEKAHTVGTRRTKTANAQTHHHDRTLRALAKNENA